jgi:hypothetical protein
MTSSTGSSDAGVVDVLYAVALGEGFFAAMYGIREDLVAGEFLPFGAGGQTLSRVLLGIFIVIVSWLYYRRAVIPGRDYPTSEFAIDIIVMVAYMAMLSFADSPAIFYSVIAVIWMMYLLARIASRQMNKAYLVFGLGFVAFFVVLSATTFFDQGIVGEWLRIIMVTIGVAAYRVLDVKLRTRFRFD